jgi:hypothetical protein
VKKEKSVASVVSTHILTTSIVIPFFGLLAAYYASKFLGTSVSQGLMMIIKDIIYISFFTIGVKYSLSYIEKKIAITNPQDCSKYSIITFAIIMIFMLIIDILAAPTLIGIIYNLLFFGIIFAIFFIFTKNYFEKFHQEV